MIKKLTSIGSSLGIIIHRPVLEFLDIGKDGPLETKIDGEVLFIRPVKLSRENRVRASAKRMASIHRDTMRKVAR